MNSDKEALFSKLYREVISSQHICSGCGACVLICPKDRLVLQEFRPQQISGDEDICPVNVDGKCGLCALVCPRLENNDARSSANGVFGKYKEIVAARSTDAALREKAQDGGLVSGLCRWAIESGAWSSFLGYSRDENWRGSPLVVTNSDKAVQTCGSKYTYISIDEGLKRLFGKGLASKPFGLVGLPCHIEAVRKMRELHAKYVRGLQLSVGLLCTKAFSYSGLIENKLVKNMGIAINEVNKVDIKKGMFTVEMDSGEEHRIPVKELQQYSHSGCPSCADFSAEHADVSAGGLGISGWTVAIIRTDAGLDAIRAARSSGYIETRNAEDFPKALGLLEKLSNWKRQNSVRA